MKKFCSLFTRTPRLEYVNILAKEKFCVTNSGKEYKDARGGMINMAETVRLNKYNRSSSDFVTPGMQLHYVAQVKPDETAAIVVHKDWQEERISWSELDKLSSRIAWMLMDKGVGQNSTVLVSYPNTIEHIAANFAIWKTGACYMPISWRTPPEELLELQKLLCPSAALTDIDVTETMFKCGMSELSEACAGYPDEMPPDVISNPNIINASGGSTGKPKLIRQNIPCGHSDLSLSSWFEVSGMKMDQTQLLCGPLFHGAPHIAAMNGIFAGGTLVLPQSLCPEFLIDCIEKYDIKFLQTVPTLMHRMIKIPGLKKESFAGMEALCHTGGVCSEWLKRAWLQLISPEKLYEMYSMTEVIGMCAIRGDEWLKHPGSVGQPKYGSKISIRDSEGNELAPFEIGNIFMSPPAGHFYTEYINEKPLDTKGDNFRSVGDMGYVDNENYLYFSDRRCDMIVTGGENVFAAEVENALLRNLHVLDAVIVGIPDPEWGRRIHAVLETDGELDVASIKEFLKNYLVPYKIPKTFEIVKRIPRLDNGKVAREAILKDCISRGV